MSDKTIGNLKSFSNPEEKLWVSFLRYFKVFRKLIFMAFFDFLSIRLTKSKFLADIQFILKLSLQLKIVIDCEQVWLNNLGKSLNLKES